MRDRDLWQRIRESLLPEPAVFGGLEAVKTAPLALRLQEEENWEPDFAARAVEEYARFIYLSRVSPDRVTPSDIVDTVWHAHITDSRAYVEEFCQRLFGQIVHHVPSAGPGDRDRHAAQFEATLAFYREEFGAAPPAEYWYHYSPEQGLQDLRQVRIAKLSGAATGIGLAAILYMAFGWTLFAIFLGVIAAWALEAVLRPRVPGPRIKKSDSDGCGSGCGD